MYPPFLRFTQRRQKGTRTKSEYESTSVAASLPESELFFSTGDIFTYDGFQFVVEGIRFLILDEKCFPFSVSSG